MTPRQPVDLALRGVTRRFGDVTALGDVSLAVAAGELCVVVGPSGCGKSTLLRAVAGLENVDEGTVRIGGDDVTSLPPRDRDVAFVFQSYALYPHLSVRANLEFPLKVRGVGRDERRRRAEETARVLDIVDLLDRKPRALSGGQRQRVAMGRAVIRRPKLFLFDEPLSNLDARLRGRMRIELVELHRRLATTTLYVTHDQAEAMTLGERVVVMKAGRILQQGSPHDIYHRPLTPFVASFFGSPPMNLVAGRVEGGRFTWSGGTVPCPAALASGEATLGIRPEDLGPGEGLARLVVRVVEDLGSERFVFGRAGDDEIAVRLDRATPAPSPGDLLPVRVHGAVHWFSDGRRVDRLADREPPVTPG